MLGLLADGKFHTIVAKNRMGEPIAAETQMQLLWDTKNRCPVLFLESIHYKGGAKGDHTLQKAVQSYAKRYAADLGLNLISNREGRDAKFKFLKGKYNGKVVSMGGSSPVSFLNFKHGSFFGNHYHLGPMFLT
jgi:hypothetical protein